MALSEKELIFNLALGHVGDYVVEDGAANTKQYLICDRYYESARKKTIKAHPWNECVDRVIIPEQEYGAIFEFSNRYALPSDHLKIMSINEQGIDLLLWEVESGYIKTDDGQTPQTWVADQVYVAGMYVTLSSVIYLCNESHTSATATSPATDTDTWTTTGGDRKVIYVRYIWDNDDPSTYSEDLKHAISIQLAILVCSHLTNDVKTKKDLIQEFKQITMPDARSVDAQEGKPRRFYNSMWNRVRRGGVIGGGRSIRPANATDTL